MRQRGGFLTGGVSFSALKPGRSIPARVIFLIGMNDDVFPRRPQPAQFDLMAKWQTGRSFSARRRSLRLSGDDLCRPGLPPDFICRSLDHP